MYPFAAKFACPKYDSTQPSQARKTNFDLQVLYKCITFVLHIINRHIMNSASIRKQTSFRLNEDLIIRLQAEAKRHNRSLNNLVESVLMAFVSQRPNPTTLAAMKEAETSEELEILDMSNFRSFVDSL